MIQLTRDLIGSESLGGAARRVRNGTLWSVRRILPKESASGSCILAIHVTKAPNKPKSRTRLTPEAREKMILDEAVRYFAEYGLNAPTRELARRLGVTQPLIYRYFPSKERLIERLFEQLVAERWDPEWERELVDRNVPLANRLTSFFLSYTSYLFTYEHMRTFFFMWLAGDGLRERFAGSPNRRFFRLIAKELRQEFRLPSPTAVPITKIEEELVWGLLGSVMYLGIREFVFGIAPRVSKRRLVRAQVSILLKGIKPELEAAVSNRKPRPRRSKKPTA